MKLATAFFSALALMGYAAAAVTVPEQSSPAGRDPREAMSYELGYNNSTAENESAAIQTFTTQSITVNSLSTGAAVEAVYQSPNKGRVTLNLLNSNDDILIHVDARFDWYGWMDVLVLNSKTAHGGWQQEAHPKGFPFPCCGYVTTITLRVEIGEEAFIISANGLEIAQYPYRGALCPPVNEIQYIFEDTGASVKAKLESLFVDY